MQQMSAMQSPFPQYLGPGFIITQLPVDPLHIPPAGLQCLLGQGRLELAAVTLRLGLASCL